MLMKNKYCKTSPCFRFLYSALTITLGLLIVYGMYLILKEEEPHVITQQQFNSMNSDEIEIEVETEPFIENIEYPVGVETAKSFDETIASKYCVLVDRESNTVMAQRNAEVKMYPASMTKIMTLIVAVETMTSLDDTFTMTYDILAPLYDADASLAGFEEHEVVTIKDMLYGAILPSGADATTGLAIKLAGSEEKFVKLMNEKAKEIGLKNTHFCNTSGLHQDNHYTTALDMAVMTEYALNNGLCREILSTYQYTTSKTKEHPKGILLESTMFSRMYGDEVEGVQILGGKTGYTSEAQHTMASFAKKNGKEYILVTAYEDDKWGSVYDAFDIYEKYLD